MISSIFSVVYVYRRHILRRFEAFHSVGRPVGAVDGAGDGDNVVVGIGSAGNVMWFIAMLGAYG